jgi:hypothetical protein
MIHFKTLSWKNFLGTGNQPTVIQLDKATSTLILGINGTGKCVRGDTVVQVTCNDEDTSIKLKSFLNRKTELP